MRDSPRVGSALAPRRRCCRCAAPTAPAPARRGAAPARCVVRVDRLEQPARADPAPKSGRITRSPGSVPRMIRIACRTSSSYSAIAIAPSAVTATGNAQPRPRNALGRATRSRSAASCRIVSRSARRAKPTDDRRAAADGVADARRRLSADQHGRAARDDRCRADAARREAASRRCAGRRRARPAAADQHIGRAGPGDRRTGWSVGSRHAAAAGMLVLASVDRSRGRPDACRPRSP